MKTRTLLIAGMLAALQTSAGNYIVTDTQKKSETEDTGIKGKVMITAGVGLNMLSPSLQIRYGLGDYWSGHTRSIKGRETPMFNLGVDYGLAPKFSVGLAFGYQEAQVFIYRDYYGKVIHNTDTWQRLHVAARGDYYVSMKEKTNMYIGLKLGYNEYSLVSTDATSQFPDYRSKLNVMPSPVSVQGHFGINTFFTKTIGFNAEAGIGVGVPYVLAVGLVIKI